MTKGRHRGPTIPSRPSYSNSALGRELGTSRTANTEGPKVDVGTDTSGIPGINYVLVPPVRQLLKEDHGVYWTMDRIVSALGGVAIITAIVIFFNRMDTNISDVKADVKDEKNSISKLDESVTTALQRLENQIQRTQDFIQNKKR